MVRQENNQVRHFTLCIILWMYVNSTKSCSIKVYYKNVNWVAFVVKSISYSPLSALYGYGNLLVRFLEIFMLLAYLTQLFKSSIGQGTLSKAKCYHLISTLTGIFFVVNAIESISFSHTKSFIGLPFTTTVLGLTPNVGIVKLIFLSDGLPL